MFSSPSVQSGVSPSAQRLMSTIRVKSTLSDDLGGDSSLHPTTSLKRTRQLDELGTNPGENCLPHARISLPAGAHSMSS